MRRCSRRSKIGAHDAVVLARVLDSPRRAVRLNRLFRQNGEAMDEVIQITGRERHPDLNITPTKTTTCCSSYRRSANTHQCVWLQMEATTTLKACPLSRWASTDTRIVKTTVYNTPDCSERTSKVYASQMCVLEKDKRKDFCHLNRGSPVTVRGNNQDFLVGLAIDSHPCADDKPVLLARASKSETWVKKNTRI